MIKKAMQIEVVIIIAGIPRKAMVLLHATPWPTNELPPMHMKGTFFNLPPGGLPKEAFSLEFHSQDPFFYRGMMSGGADFDLLRLDMQRPLPLIWKDRLTNHRLRSKTH